MITFPSISPSLVFSSEHLSPLLSFISLSTNIPYYFHSLLNNTHQFFFQAQANEVSIFQFYQRSLCSIFPSPKFSKFVYFSKLLSSTFDFWKGFMMSDLRGELSFRRGYFWEFLVEGIYFLIEAFHYFELLHF